MGVIKIKKQIFFDERGVFGYFSKEPNEPIAAANINKEFILEDIYGRQYNCYLRTVVRIGFQIPEVLAYHCEGVNPEIAKKYIEKRGVDTSQPLAYYVYQKK